MQGIPVKIATYDEQGEPTGNYEVAVFATLRRCPKLAGLLKAIQRADVAEDAATVRASVARRKLMAAETPEDIDAAETAAMAAMETLCAAQQALADAVHAFLVAGFVGAGYTDEEAERYTAMLPRERYRELNDACLIGAGRLDFTNAPTAAAG